MKFQFKGINYSCKKCGSEDVFNKENGLYCSNCGKWIKWLSKDEMNLLEHATSSADTVSVELSNTKENIITDIKQQIKDASVSLNGMKLVKTSLVLDIIDRYKKDLV